MICVFVEAQHKSIYIILVTLDDFFSADSIFGNRAFSGDTMSTTTSAGFTIPAATATMELDSGSHVAAVIQPTTAPSSTAQSAAQSDIAALTHRLDQQDTRGRSSTSDHGSRHGSRSNTPDRIYAFITPATE